MCEAGFAGLITPPRRGILVMCGNMNGIFGELGTGNVEAGCQKNQNFAVAMESMCCLVALGVL